MPEQLALFQMVATEAIRLRVHAATEEARRKAMVRAGRAMRERVIVLQLDLWGTPVEVCIWVTKQRGRSATKPAALVSDVFAFAEAGKSLKINRGGGSTSSEPAISSNVVIREGDVVRNIARRVQDTEEWAEKERIRRAKQKPPKPPKQSFTLGKKGRRVRAEPEGMG